MAANPLAFVKDLFGKIITAAGKLPAPFLFAILAVITLIVGLIGMALLRIDLQNNVLLLFGIVLVGALIGWSLIELKGRPQALSPTSERASTTPPSTGASAPQTIYDSQKSPSLGFDFRGWQSAIFQGGGKEAKPITEIGRGELLFEDGGVLNVRRENTDGRFEIKLLRYSYLGVDREYLPQNDLIAGRRKLELRFEAKVSRGAKHTLKAVLKNEESLKWLASAQVIVRDDQWAPFRLYLPADPSLSACLRIDDQDVSVAPSSIQLRKILFLEQGEA